MATILYAGRYDELAAVGFLLYICLAVLALQSFDLLLCGCVYKVFPRC
ncbi:hypothetical protein FOMG_18940 [Fusarium oxysporum f. sp. melonis 26406]|uniref:Uncharacterized protein n=1 Tax=Fusarium oxysporum f. sp. melonis 26406 TaxID=1089452 RepID=W9Z7U0_FUSOX|nr:hypothetical protein FOMG_18958 [Fusarium oxysporum f. sp. melonis 26406]EXK24328.1 hypothetical protein FOMG_18940 [Fusarium oxysporum f. sp. melonis 26406]